MTEITDYLNFIAVDNFRTAKDCMKRMRRQATKEENDAMSFKIYKESLKLKNK